MKNRQLHAFRKDLETLNAAEQDQLKGGYGRELGYLRTTRNNRWDDIPFRRASPNFGSSRTQPQGGGGWNSLVKESLFRP